MKAVLMMLGISHVSDRQVQVSASLAEAAGSLQADVVWLNSMAESTVMHSGADMDCLLVVKHCSHLQA